MTTPTDAQAVWDRPADRLRETAERRYTQLRANPALNDAARRGLIAKAWTQLRNDMEQAQGLNSACSVISMADAMRRLHGIDDLTGTASQAERATMAISHRDATDRAGRLTSPEEAQQLLDTANNTGDELLARAVGSHVINQARTVFGSAYTDVAQQYLDARPRQAQAWNDVQSHNKNLNVATMFEYVTPAPPELAGLGESAIRQLAANADQYAV